MENPLSAIFMFSWFTVFFAPLIPLVSATTPQNDLDGLAKFIDNFDQLKRWSGEPCLPNDTSWQWLNCSSDQPPRVTSIHLSGYGLQGYLPDFSQMDALQAIDLHNNRLHGKIPDFLGKLPNLRILDLRDNNFSGDVPGTISDNDQLKYMIDGPEKTGIGTGVEVGLIAAFGSIFFILVFIFYYFCILKFLLALRPPPSPPPPPPPPPPPLYVYPPSPEHVTIVMEETVHYGHVNLGR